MIPFFWSHFLISFFWSYFFDPIFWYNLLNSKIHSLREARPNMFNLFYQNLPILPCPFRLIHFISSIYSPFFSFCICGKWQLWLSQTLKLQIPLRIFCGCRRVCGIWVRDFHVLSILFLIGLFSIFYYLYFFIFIFLMFFAGVYLNRIMLYFCR